LVNGAALTPSLEPDAKHDADDVETGFGLDIGADIRWHDLERCITGDVRGRTLLIHTEKEFREQG